MKKKLIHSTLLTVILLALTVGAVGSIRFGTISGIWGIVDEGGFEGDPQGAYCLRYAEGPAKTTQNPNVFSATDITIGTGPSVQDPDSGDWKQVRYGLNRYGSCSTVNDYKLQSGLAFLSAEALVGDPNFDQGVPFLLGKFCHVNNPVLTGDNEFNTVPLAVTINNLRCAVGQTMIGAPGGAQNVDMTYFINVRYYETADDSTCKWGWTGNRCNDAAVPSQPTDQVIQCQVEGDDDPLNYYLQVLGFTDVEVSGDGSNCNDETFDPNNYQGAFISPEESINCACLWAQVSDIVPTAVELNYFKPEGGNEEILVKWQTAFEMDNVGFNIYRSTTADFKDAIKLNDEMIKSLVPAGSTYGAVYEFSDKNANPYNMYFYWLEDIDVNGAGTLHGPETASWIE